MANRFPAMLVLFLLTCTSMIHFVHDDVNVLEDLNSVEQSSGTASSTDTPSWRIGDKWTYETQFDVAQLIAQANVSASLNTLTGDTVYEIEDIFFISVDGIQTLSYKMKIEGAFSSGNSGANLEGVSGRLDIDYTGEDIIRVRDLAVINSEFELDVDFAPFNLGFLTQNIATINFDTYYDPPKERYDFPLRTGDQWYMPFMSAPVSAVVQITSIHQRLIRMGLRTIRGKSPRTVFQQKMGSTSNTKDVMIPTKSMNGTQLE